MKFIINKIRHKLGFYYCPVCENRVGYFSPLSYSFIKKTIDSGYKYFGCNEHFNASQYSCPICSANDRDRLYVHYISNTYLKNNTDKKLRFLEIAPSNVTKFLKSKNYDIKTADLMMPDVDYKVNVENMACFKDNTFDFIIFSHVLEHVENPNKALKEIYRILKPGGEAIIMAPVIPQLEKTLEDKSHKTSFERLKNYGQEDHLRLFAKNDFKNLITANNFKLNEFGINNFGEITYFKLGITPTAILYTGKK
jgi:SAM-dependent methyltransferase